MAAESDVVHAWRISSQGGRWLANDLSGIGAARHPGRWNSRDLPILYSSSSIAHAFLETMVHLTGIDPLPFQRKLVRLTIPSKHWRERRRFEFGGRNQPPNPADAEVWLSSTRAWGDEWLWRGDSLIAEVPSLAVPGEQNILLNPLHPAYGDVRGDVIQENLFKGTHENLDLATVAAQALQSGSIESWNELLRFFRYLPTTGLVGPDGQPLGRNTQEFTKIIVDVSQTNEQIMKMLAKDPEIFWQLPARKFEEIVAEMLEKKGYSVSLTQFARDGGVDIFAAKKDGLGQYLYLVECKRYVPPYKVGVEIVRSLYGVLQAKKATACAIVTSSYFTNGAKEFQREQQHQVALHDYLVLQQWIKGLSTRQIDDAEQ
jgi:RES domain-containing protein